MDAHRRDLEGVTRRLAERRRTRYRAAVEVTMQLGDVLRTLRELRGWDLALAARHLDLPEERLGGIERGDPPSVAEIVGLERALGLDMRRLPLGQVEEAGEIQPARVFFLHNPSSAAFNTADLPTLGRALGFARTWAGGGGGEGLRRRLGLRPVESAGPSTRDAAWHGYRLAQEVRLLLGEPYAPLGDLRQILEERLGMVVLVAAFQSTGVRAAGALDEGRAAAVAVLGEGVKKVTQQRFALAHELCHLLFDPVSARSVQISLDRDTFSDKQADLREARANGFAAELLLPSLGISRLLGTDRIDSADAAMPWVREAQQRFGCGAKLAIHHLKNRGWYSDLVRSELLLRLRERPGDFLAPVAADLVPSLPAIGGGPRVLEGTVREEPSPASVWQRAVRIVAEKAEERRHRVEEALARSEELKRAGKPDRAATAFVVAVLDAVEQGDVTVAAQLVDALAPERWGERATLGLLGGLRTVREHLRGAYERLLDRSRGYLAAQPGWSEERVGKALAGL